MRKLIVLIMTSVLATGAVANADDVSVVEDIGDFINIKPITEGDASAGSPANASALQPGLTGDREQYTIRGQIVEEYETENLEKVAVCLFDKDTADVATLCGYGTDGADLTATKADIGSDNPESALQASFETTDLNTFDNDQTNLHDVVSADSVASREGSFRTSASTDSLHFNITVELSHALAAASNQYKVRVVGIYDDNTVLELIDDTTYSVESYISYQTQRDEIDFGELIPGGIETVSNKNAGSYYSNLGSQGVDLYIAASDFNVVGDEATTVPVTATNATIETAKENRFFLNCLDQNFDTAGTDNATVSSRWLGNSAQTIYNRMPGSNSQTDPEDEWTVSSTMECKLQVGDAVEINDYTNQVTMSIVAR